MALLFALAVTAGACSTLSQVALRSSIPEIVGAELRGRANGLLATSRSLAMVAGFASAGVVVAQLGYRAAFAMDAASFVVSATVLSLLPITTRAAADPEADGDEAPSRWAALTVLRTMPVLAVMVAVRAADGLGSSSHNVGLPIYSSHLDPAHPAAFISRFWATWAIGNIVAQQVLGRYAKRTGRAPGEWAFALGACAMSAAFIVVFTGPPGVLGVAVALAAGIADGLTEIAYVIAAAGPARQQARPDVRASASVENGGFGLGMIVSAALMERFSPLPVVACVPRRPPSPCASVLLAVLALRGGTWRRRAAERAAEPVTRRWKGNDHDRASTGRDVAVIGMAFRFPGADTLEDYLADHPRRRVPSSGASPTPNWPPPASPRIRRRRTSSAPADCSPTSRASTPSTSRMSAREATLTDPQHRLFLECAQHALEDAGYARTSADGGRVGVYASTGYHLYPCSTTCSTTSCRAGTGAGLAARGWRRPSGTTPTSPRLARVPTRPDGPAVNVQTPAPVRWSPCRSPRSRCYGGECDLAARRRARACTAAGHRLPLRQGLDPIPRAAAARPSTRRPTARCGGTGVAARRPQTPRRGPRRRRPHPRRHPRLGRQQRRPRPRPRYTAPGRRRAARGGPPGRCDAAGAGRPTGSATWRRTAPARYKGDPIEFAAPCRRLPRGHRPPGYCAIGASRPTSATSTPPPASPA